MHIIVINLNERQEVQKQIEIESREAAQIQEVQGGQTRAQGKEVGREVREGLQEEQRKA